MPQTFDEIQIGALDGVLDLASMPEQMNAGSVRFRQNFQNEEGRMSRRQGWRRFLAELSGSYTNQDLHDQLLPIQLYYKDNSDTEVSLFPTEDCLADLKQRIAGREFITSLLPVVTSGGSRVLFACTQSRIYEFNESIGNWRLLGDGFGGSAPDMTYRFAAAGAVKDVVVFSNNYDPIMHYKIGDRHDGCSIRALRPIPDLQRLRVYKAYEVFAHKDTMMLMNVMIDGDRLEGRIIASDYKDATAYDLAETSTGDSTASYQDLPSGHRILRAMQFGDRFLVYTNRGIIRGETTGVADRPFIFQTYYENKDGERCLAYRNTLVQYGNAHYFMGTDAIYKVDNFTDGPEPVEWLNKSAITIFTSINSRCCESPCAGVWSHGNGADRKDREIWFSWPKGDNCMPTETLAAQPETKFTDLIDAGFTAFANYQNDPRPTIADWLRSLCICDADDISGYKHGLPRADQVCSVTPVRFMTSESITFEDIEVEDYDVAEADADSLYSILGDRSTDDFCVECNNEYRFIAASARDKCIKEMGGALSREFCSNAETGVGTVVGTFNLRTFAGSYFVDGYDSVIRIGPIGFGKSTIEKTVNSLIAELEADPDINKLVVAMRLGYAYSPLDANSDKITWTKYIRQPLRNPQTLTPDEYRAANLRPARGLRFPLYQTGRYFFVEMMITGLEDQNNIQSAFRPAIGGPSHFSSIRAEVRRAY